MRLIDADSLLKYLFVTESRTGGSVYAQAYEQGWDDALKAVMENAPTVADLVNVVDVVRCKDCRHWVGKHRSQCPVKCKTFGYCDLWEQYVGNGEKFFCAYGERRENDGSD